MYTARIISKNLDRASRKILIEVLFTDELNQEHTEVFTFDYGEESSFIQDTIKTYIKDTEKAERALDEIKLGEIDLSKKPPEIFVRFFRDEKNSITTG